MVAEPQKPEITALIRRAEIARSKLGRDVTSLRDKLDAPARVCKSFRHHPFAWLTGTAASGLLLTRLVFRRRPKKISRFLPLPGLTGRALALLISAATPALKIWLIATLKQYLSRRANSYHPPTSIG